MKLSEKDIINWWLGKFHNTNLDEVVKKHGYENNNDQHTRDFYNTYAITEEQYAEFEHYFYKEVPKILRISQKHWKRAGAFTYLNVAPNVKKS